MPLDQFADGGIVVDKAIGFWLNRVYQRTRTEMYRLFAREGEELTPEQWMVLIRLWEREGLSQAELSDQTLRDAPTMSRLVAGMERRGLLERRRSTVDARVHEVFLTRKSRALEKKLVPLVRGLVERATEGIPAKDLRTFRGVLERMFENLAPE